jgi:CPA2 family monovalent cation:H+ antiporter-2
VHDVHHFLAALTAVLGVAALTTVLFQRLRQPVVLGYILAGLIVGPHVPVPLVADRQIVQTLAELGVILLMFALGLEFSLRKLVQVGPSAGLTGIVQCSIMLWLGFVLGRLFGWTALESAFAGGIVAISSTTIIAKAFDELKIGGALRSLVVGVLIVEDLIGILLMAVLTPLAKGAGVSATELAMTVVRLVLFLGALLAVGMLVVPRLVRWIRRLDRPETTLVSALGICFGVALLANAFGYSVALGAFIAGSLVAESGEEKYVEHLIQPVRDMFAAIFFVSVGMLLDPAVLVRYWPAILAFTGLVIVGKLASVSFGAFLSGQSPRTSIQAGMSLAQIGEFSFIIAGLGLSLEATGDFIYPLAASVSALTTLTTPWLIRASGPVASFVDRKMPRPLQTVASLYGSWLERVRSAPDHRTTAAQVRRVARALAVDAVVIATLVIGATLGAGRAGRALADRLGIDPPIAHWMVVATAGAAAIPFCAGVLRNSRRMGLTLAASALPAAAPGQTDLAAAPRRALVVMLQLGAVLITSLPILAVTQPFLSGAPGLAILAVLLAVLGISFWRSVTNLQGHVRAGAQVIVDNLAQQARGDRQAPAAPHPQQPPPHPDDALQQLRALLPGLGEPVAFQLEASSPALGKTLAALNVRGLTGATVLAIWRPEGGVVPTSREVLRPGDVLALAGSREAVALARQLLSGAPAEAAGERLSS